MIDGALAVNHKPTKPSLEGVLDHIEAILIASSEPPLNLQRGRFGQDVEQYLQHGIDDEDEEDEE